MNLPLVVGPADLKNAQIEQLKIVDLRSAEAYAEAHLPGAVHLDLGLLNRSDKWIGGLLPDAEAVNTLTKTIGLRSGDHVLAYDAGGTFAAARLIWVLHAYGFEAISWLNGGFGAWTSAGMATSADAVEVNTDKVATLNFTPGNVLSVDEVIAILDDDDIQLLDVRSAEEYNGTDVRADRGGHVPNAAHSEWTDAFNSAGALKSADELKALLADAGIKSDQHVVVYCQTHQRSSLTYLVLKHLQYNKVSAIDGAWSAWGNRDDTPIDS